MGLVYLFLGAVVAYCLFQSIRFRIAARRPEGAGSPDMGLLSGVTPTPPERGADDHLERALLTPKGRKFHFKYRVYNAMGLLAAITLILLWLNDTGLLEVILDRVARAPAQERAQP